MPTSRAPVLDQRCLKPVPCSQGAGGLHSTREAADGKGRVTSWLQKLNTKGPTGNLNKLIKPIFLCSELVAQFKKRRWPWFLSQGWQGCITSSDWWEKPGPWGQVHLWGPKPDGFWTRTLHTLQAHFILPRLGAWGSRSTPLGRWEGSLNAEQELLVCVGRCQFTNSGNALLRPTCWIYCKRSQIVWNGLY